MDTITRKYIFGNEIFPTFFILLFAIYLIYKIYKKIVKKIPFVNITRKTDLHRDIKKHINNNHRKYEFIACVLIPIFLFFSIYVSKNLIMDFPKLILNEYENLNCIALDDSKTISGGKHSRSSNNVMCVCEGEKLRIRYVPETLKVKKGQKIKVNYLINLEIGTIIDVE